MPISLAYQLYNLSANSKYAQMVINSNHLTDFN